MSMMDIGMATWGAPAENTIMQGTRHIESKSSPTEVVLQPYDMVMAPREEGDEIHIWALDRESKPSLLRLRNIPITCYLELPLWINNIHAIWTEGRVAALVNAINRVMGYEGISNHSFVAKPKIYLYREDRKTPMVHLLFKTQDAMRHCINLVKKPRNYKGFGQMSFKVWEDRISPIRKLFTLRQCRFAQWFKIKAREIPYDDEERLSTPGSGLASLQPHLMQGTPKYLKDIGEGIARETPTIEMREFIANATDLTPIPLEETQSWVTNPRLLAFDIETYSDNHKSFPNPLTDAHVCYMISCVYQSGTDPSTRRRFIIVYGICNDIPGSDVIRVNSEADLVDAMAMLVRILDPEIVTGYNIFGFDYHYLDRRLTLSAREMRDWPQMCRLEDVRPKMVSKSWQSSGYGHNNLDILQLQGRISIDMLPIVKRDYKLLRYSLDFVGHHFLGQGKHDVDAPEMFRIYEMCRDAKTPDDIKIAKSEMSRVMAYCIQDAELVIDLFNKLNTWIALVEMSNIVGVTIVELFTRGQMIRCQSQIYDLAARRNYVLDSREHEKRTVAGGAIREPIRGVSDNVICLDFSSMYPSTIRAYNICYTTLVPPEMDDIFPDEKCNIIEFDQQEEEDGKTVTRSYRYRFVKAEVRQGILPTLVANLVNERNQVRARMRELKKDKIDDNIQFQLVVLDKRQNALKISANSMYGFLGVQEGGLMPLLEGSMSVTGMGRRHVGEVVEFVREKYNANVIYGDTDSVMFTLPNITDPKDCITWGKRIAEEISGRPAKINSDGTITPAVPGLFPPPISVEFEKAMRILCIMKKKYAAYTIGDDGKFEMDDDKEYLLIRGIVLARRDNCKFVQRIYERVLRCILNKEGFTVSLTVLTEEVTRLLRGEVDAVEDLSIVRELGANYKSDTYFMKVFSDELRKKGKPVDPGERLTYVVVKPKDSTPGKDHVLGEKMRLVEDFAEGDELIDYSYYIGNLLTNPIDQLFEVAYSANEGRLTDIGYEPQYSRARFVSILTPVKMISKIIDDLYPSMSTLYTDKEIFAWIAETYVKAIPSMLR